MSFWTDIIAYSPAWVDVPPEAVARFISGVSGSFLPDSLVRVSEPELACFGMLDVNGDARREAANPDMDRLLKRLVAQARQAEILDSDATGEYEPPSWTELSDTHVGPYFHAEGAPSKICRALAAASPIPFAELEVRGLRPGTQVTGSLSASGPDRYLDFSEITLEIGPDLAVFLDEAPEFAGWLRVALSGEGQPYPLTKPRLIRRARECEPLQKILAFAADCLGVKEWHWTLSCSG